MSLISVICVLPYVLTIQGDLLNSIGIPIALILFAQLIQTTVLFSIIIILGLFFTKKVGFGLPLIQALIEKKNYKKVLKDILGLSVGLGVLTAVIIFALDPIFTFLGAGVSTHQTIVPIWQKLLASFYGGITEEILLRLFLMSFFVWIGMKLFKKKQPTVTGIWIAIFLAAIIFGIGHLPITATLTQITPLVITRAIILNGVGGVIFGWLFWKKGLESAMIAHFTADIFLLTLLPLVFSI